MALQCTDAPLQFFTSFHISVLLSHVSLDVGGGTVHRCSIGSLAGSPSSAPEDTGFNLDFSIQGRTAQVQILDAHAGSPRSGRRRLPKNARAHCGKGGLEKVRTEILARAALAKGGRCVQRIQPQKPLKPEDLKHRDLQTRRRGDKILPCSAFIGACKGKHVMENRCNGRQCWMAAGEGGRLATKQHLGSLLFGSSPSFIWTMIHSEMHVCARLSIVGPITPSCSWRHVWAAPRQRQVRSCRRRPRCPALCCAASLYARVQFAGLGSNGVQVVPLGTKTFDISAFCIAYALGDVSRERALQATCSSKAKCRSCTC